MRSTLFMLSMSSVMEAVASSAVATFNFSCPTYGAPSVFSSSSNSSWTGSFASARPNDFECSQFGSGITPVNATEKSLAAPVLESTLSMGSLKRLWREDDSDAISFEFWITLPAMTSTEYLGVPIFTIGQNMEALTANPMNSQSSDCAHYDLELTQFRTSLLGITFKDDVQCNFQFIEIDSSAETLVQLVVAINNEKLAVFINGQSTNVDGFPIWFDQGLQNWNSDYEMQLFSNYVSGNASVFKGVMHHFSIYDYALDEVMARESYTTKLVSNGHPTEDPNGGRLGKSTRDSAGESTGDDGTQMEGSNLPTIFAAPPSTVRIPQDQADPEAFKVVGSIFYDTEVAPSSVPWTFQIEILSLPDNGVLTSSTGKAIHVGDCLNMSRMAQEDALSKRVGGQSIVTIVNYTLRSTGYFNEPTVTATGESLDVQPETFDYRIIATTLESHEVKAESAPVSQEIHVVHVNHPPTLSIARKNLTLTDTKFEGLFSDRLPTGVVKEKIVLSDGKDYNMDRVRVDVSAKNGVLTLNSEHRHLADFVSCQLRDPTFWTCIGNGFQDKFMTFVAFTSDVELILSDIVYESFHYDTPDEISIRVWDGEGRNCLSEEEHRQDYSNVKNDGFMTVYRGRCYETTVVIEVQVKGGTVWKDDEVYNKPDIVRNIIIWTFAIAGICACGILYSCMKRIFAGSSKAMVGAEDVNEKAPEASEAECKEDNKGDEAIV